MMTEDIESTMVYARELQRRDSQAQLDDERSQLERNRLGQFATPNVLAAEIAAYLLGLLDDKEPINFLEPALGSGSFYSALLQVVESVDRINSAVGLEIDPRFCALARELWGEFGLRVIEGDYTDLYRDMNEANLVLTNPPYVRHHHIDKSTKVRLQAEANMICEISINGLSGLYVYFMALAHDNLANEGVAAWLVPSEFMDVNYGSALREYLTKKVQLIRIHRFDPSEVQFGDALVSSAVVIFRKSTPNSEADVCFTLGGTFLEPRKTEEVSLRSLSSSHKWTTFPRLKLLPSWDKRITIGDLFEVRRGVVTGANSYFVMSKHKAQSLGLPDRYLKPVLPSPRYLTTDVIIEGPDGYPFLDRQLVLFDCDLPEAALLGNSYIKLREYIVAGIEMGINERYLPSRRSPWYRQEKRPPAPFLSTYMGRGTDGGRPFRFIWNQSKAIATNVYLLLYPKPLLKEIISSYERATLIHEGLNCLEADELREEGRVYGGGLYKIEPGELKRMSARPLIERLPELDRVMKGAKVSTSQSSLF